MMGMLGEDALAPAGARMPQPPPHIAGHLSAMRAAFAGMSSGRLPPHLLFSDRDFNEDDYEALLALDDTVENRKGGCSDSSYCCVNVNHHYLQLLSLLCGQAWLISRQAFAQCVTHCACANIKYMLSNPLTPVQYCRRLLLLGSDVLI